MQWLQQFACLLWGHDDHLRRTSGKMFLECWDCGRTTSGWTFPTKPGERRRRPRRSASDRVHAVTGVANRLLSFRGERHDRSPRGVSLQ